jgi:hypothetical protein
MDRKKTQTVVLASGPGFEPGAPLHQRAPRRDAEGRPVSDLMLLFPALKKGLQPVVDRVSAELAATLAAFGERVLFAELNLKLGLLWVSVRAEPGLCHEVAQTVRARLPEARVVGSWLEGPVKPRLQSSYSEARRASPRTLSRG